MIRLIAEGVGLNGDNPAYVRNTYEHLLRLDIHDAELAEVVRRLDHEFMQSRDPRPAAPAMSRRRFDATPYATLLRKYATLARTKLATQRLRYGQVRLIS